MNRAVGIIETKGLVYTIACSDVALKAANVELLGYESSRGDARFVIKLLGNVGAVRAAIDAALALAKENGVQTVGFAIPRPSDDCWTMLVTEEGETSGSSDPVSAENAENLSDVVLDEAETEKEEGTELAMIRPGICNICNDPKCPRRKGEPHNLCIHFDDNHE